MYVILLTFGTGSVLIHPLSSHILNENIVLVVGVLKCGAVFDMLRNFECRVCNLIFSGIILVAFHFYRCQHQAFQGEVAVFSSFTSQTFL